MDFSERLLKIMSHYNHNKNSFSVAIGASNNTVIGRLVNEPDRRPSFDLLELILRRFPSINPTWLIMGEGEMLINQHDFVLTESFIPYFEEIPCGSTIDDLKHLMFSFKSYSTRNSNTDKFFGLRNQNSEVGPILNLGDYVTCKIVNIDDVIPSDLLFISTRRRNYLHRLSKQSENGAQFITLVDNHGITFNIHKFDITLIGLVTNLIRIIN